MKLAISVFRGVTDDFFLCKRGFGVGLSSKTWNEEVLRQPVEEQRPRLVSKGDEGLGISVSYAIQRCEDPRGSRLSRAVSLWVVHSALFDEDNEYRLGAIPDRRHTEGPGRWVGESTGDDVSGAGVVVFRVKEETRPTPFSHGAL